MSLGLSVSSALNLTLSGSVGTFSVGTGQAAQKTVEVKYFLTHVGLNFASGANEEVLKHLAPVREIFPTTELEFDEIMQRDIDDARVSSERLDGRNVLGADVADATTRDFYAPAFRSK